MVIARNCMFVHDIAQMEIVKTMYLPLDKQASLPTLSARHLQSELEGLLA
ncbi:hypothetical protein OIN59_22375 [Acidovorax sp. D2M1]|uniref:Uncharacterized protein n=1 Tax=Acidovorax benzenivorans TaxID=2987520 RepID=A0ABT5S2P0_9BURK|nr:hypothetical protein [Acidovorax benzenivorans]